jgi:hypothetical protein
MIGRSHFRKVDVTRAVKAVVDGGKRVRAIRFPADGGFVLIVSKPGEEPAPTNDLDEWMAEHNEN